MGTTPRIERLPLSSHGLVSLVCLLGAAECGIRRHCRAGHCSATRTLGSIHAWSIHAGGSGDCPSVRTPRDNGDSFAKYVLPRAPALPSTLHFQRCAHAQRRHCVCWMPLELFQIACNFLSGNFQAQFSRHQLNIQTRHGFRELASGQKSTGSIRRDRKASHQVSIPALGYVQVRGDDYLEVVDSTRPHGALFVIRCGLSMRVAKFRR